MSETNTAPREEAIAEGDLAPYLEMASARFVSVGPLAGGASREMFGIELETETGPRRLVLRRGVRGGTSRTLDVEREFLVMQRAHAAGVMVPEPMYLGADRSGLAYMLMEFVDGEALAPRLFRQDRFARTRKVLADQMAANLAPIHAIEIDDELALAVGGRPRGNPAESALDDIEDLYRRIAPNPLPAFELVLRDLRRDLPRGGCVALVHGDYRLGNVMFDEKGLTAAVDWELAHLSDPVEDLTWAMVRAWRFGRDKLPAAGLASREDYFAAYEAAGGDPVDPERARWWEIYGNLRWGVLTIVQTLHFISGAGRDPEKAAIGRRTSEVEAELIHLILEDA